MAARTNTLDSLIYALICTVQNGTDGAFLFICLEWKAKGNDYVGCCTN